MVALHRIAQLNGSYPDNRQMFNRIFVTKEITASPNRNEKNPGKGDLENPGTRHTRYGTPDLPHRD